MDETYDLTLLLHSREHLKEADINPTDGEEIYKHTTQFKYCEFCLEPVQNCAYQWWFIPTDFSCCICDCCFNTFREMFKWRLLDGWDIDWG